MRLFLALPFLLVGCAGAYSYSMQAIPIRPPQQARAGDAPVTLSLERYQDAVGRYDQVGRACFSDWMAVSPPSIQEPTLRRRVEREARTLGADVAIVVDRCQIGRSAGISISFMKTRS